MKEVQLLKDKIYIGGRNDWHFVIDQALERARVEVPEDPEDEEVEDTFCIGHAQSEEERNLEGLMAVVDGLLAEDLEISLQPAGSRKPMHVLLRNPFVMAGHYILNAYV